MHNECVACGRRQDLDYYEDMLLEAGVVLRGRFPWGEVILVIVDFDACYLVEKDEVCGRHCGLGISFCSTDRKLLLRPVFCS